VQPVSQIIKSSIGKKVIVAVTGFFILGFVIAHMIGNLQIFLGQETLNDYAEKLRNLGEILIAMRAFLLINLVVHVFFAIWVAKENRAARPVGYVHKGTIQATHASRVMVISGILLLIYVIYHLAHFTFGSVHSQYFHFVDADGRRDVYSMVIASFQNLPISLIYIAAMGVLFYHLGHATSSFIQTLGFADDKSLPKVKQGGIVLAFLLFIGYSIIPVCVLVGVLKLPS